MKERMPKMMGRIMPLCLKEMFQHMDDETKASLKEKVTAIFDEENQEERT